MSKIKLIECPRDAMQGYSKFIETEKKINYINNLLKVGFYAIDCGSFVSEKMIPQMHDTPNVIKSLIKEESKTKIIVIVANERGALDASNYDQINIFGYPFSVSENFQIRNTNSTRIESIESVKEIKEITNYADQKLRVYLSMGFGNPYGDEFSPEIVLDWACKLADIGVEEFALSDTVGVSNSSNIKAIYGLLSRELPNMDLSVHLHSGPNDWKEKIVSAYDAGCRSFDSAIKGYGGCPMAKDDLVGNLATENLIGHFSNRLPVNFNKDLFNRSLNLAEKIFSY